MLKEDYFEFTQKEYLLGEKEIASCVNESDIFLIHGGGFIGTLWENEENVLISILQKFHRNKIIIFPQTVFFDSSSNGVNEKKRFQATIKMCSDLKIFLRDKRSYQIMTDEFSISESRCFLVPDIVTYLQMDSKGNCQNRVLFCMRNDKERVCDDKFILKIHQYLNKSGIEIAFTDTVVDGKIRKSKREEAVQKKLEEFSRANLVITDRIHGMIFAAITGTPCIAMDNISHKVSGAYEWIKYLDYIKFVKEDDLTMDLVYLMLSMKISKYSNKELEEYYHLMKEEIIQ